MEQPIDKLVLMPTRPRNRATPESIELGKRLLLALEKTGRTQSDLARALDVNRQTIQQLAAGFNANPSAGRIFRIADTLNVSARWLAMGEGDMRNETELRPGEKDLLDVYRRLKPEQQGEVSGFCRGLLGGGGQTPAAKALIQLIDSMDEGEAKKLASFLDLLTRAKSS